MLLFQGQSSKTDGTFNKNTKQTSTYFEITFNTETNQPNHLSKKFTALFLSNILVSKLIITFCFTNIDALQFEIK